MKHIFYVLLLSLCFKILYSFDTENSNLKYEDDKNRKFHVSEGRDRRRRRMAQNNTDNLNARRQNPAKLAKKYWSSGESEISSSLEKMKWKDEWAQFWLQKKLEALNSTPPPGDTVNMVAARPWGVPCGDPNQHDMAWGTCMLPMECEPEYRIYRGDYFCGRTQYVCCAIQLSTYDLYGGIDVSFVDSNEDAGEGKKRYEGKWKTKERKKRKRRAEKRRRRRERAERKKKIKKIIKRIIKEIKKIITRSYRNSTVERRERTKELKKFIKHLKKKYLYDRRLIRDIHQSDMIKIDTGLAKRLEDIRNMNEQFNNNETFRDIVVNGTVNKRYLRTLLKEYPELQNMMETRRSRSHRPDYLEYDIEYGYIYD